MTQQLPGLDIQSVLYGNAAEDIVRAADAAANSASLAIADGFISGWTLQLGDGSPRPVLGKTARARIRAIVEQAGGTLGHDVFGANLGSAAGHNRLARAGENAIMMILNPDAQMAPDTVGALVARLNADVGVVEARQVPFEHPKDYDAATGETSWASTACAVTPRVLFEELDGFDSASFFLYCDDVDYSWRARLAGKRVIYEPAAAVFHDKRLTPRGDWPASAAEIYYSAEAALILAHKYSHPEIVHALERRYARDPEPAVRRALDEYRSRGATNALPSPLDPEHRVGQFVKGNYARHRF